MPNDRLVDIMAPGFFLPAINKGQLLMSSAEVSPLSSRMDCVFKEAA
jgi:hypothetical protein